MEQLSPHALLALVAIVAAISGMVPGGIRALVSAVTGKGASGATASAEAKGVQIQMGDSGAAGRVCDRSAEHSIALKQLADVQARQVALDERMAALMERMDVRFAKLEEGVLELVMMERLEQRRRGDER